MGVFHTVAIEQIYSNMLHVICRVGFATLAHIGNSMQLRMNNPFLAVYSTKMHVEARVRFATLSYTQFHAIANEQSFFGSV